MSVPPTPDPAAERNAFHHAALKDMIDTGLGVLHTLAAAVQAAPPAPAQIAEIAVAFERVTRAVRRTILLAERLDEPAKRRAAARRHIIRDVENAIHRRAPHPAEQDRLETEFRERLDGPDILEDIDLGRPVEQIVADLCRDLALAGQPGAQPWKRRTPADIAALSARAANAGPAPAAPPPNPAAPKSPDPERLFRLLATPNHT